MNWFITINEEVTGPFATDSVLQMQEKPDFESQNTYVWGGNLDTWLKYSKWVSDHNAIISSSTETKTTIQSWYYAVNSQAKPVGPFDKLTLVEKISEIKDKDKVLIWTKGMEVWASVFEFADMLDELNISRRKHPRAKIEGSIILKNDNGDAHIGNIYMISPGGCGINNVSGLKVGAKYKVEIKSPSLFNTINAEAIILMAGDNNSYGLRFDKIHVESESTIISYLKEQDRKRSNAA